MSTGCPTDRLASILSHIVVYFDCEDTLKTHSAVDIQKYFLNSEKCRHLSDLFSDINMIKRALLNKHGRHKLKTCYNIEFTIFRTMDDKIVTPAFTTTTGYRIIFSALGTPRPNLVREFKGTRDATTTEFSKDQRVQAIYEHIHSAMALGEAVKNAIPSNMHTPSRTFEDTFTSATRSASTPIDLVDHEHFKMFSVQEQVTIICDLFDAQYKTHHSTHKVC